MTREADVPIFSDISWMRLPLPEAEAGALFGAAVAVGDDTVVIGAPSKDRQGPIGGAADVGRAYVFEWDGAHWAPVSVLDGHGTRGSLFGAAVAMHGRRIVVGAPRARARGTEHAGQVVVFVRADGRWERSARLVDPHGASPNEGFGAAVAIDGDLVVVGAPLEVSDGGPPGMVHSFHHLPPGPWTALAPAGARWRVGPDADPQAGEGPGSLFGRHLALHGDTLAVAQDRWGADPAVAVVLRLVDGAWQRRAVLRAPDPVAGPGAGIALGPDLLAVGQPTAATGGQAGAGAVCLFRRAGEQWRHEATLRAPVPAEHARFGAAVALAGEVVVVGAPGHAAHGVPDVGAVHIFEAEGAGHWACVQSFVPPGDDDRVCRARLGEAVAARRRTVVAGAPGADAGQGGAAYVIEAT